MNASVAPLTRLDYVFLKCFGNGLLSVLLSWYSVLDDLRTLEITAA